MIIAMESSKLGSTKVGSVLFHMAKEAVTNKVALRRCEGREGGRREATLVSQAGEQMQSPCTGHVSGTPRWGRGG